MSLLCPSPHLFVDDVWCRLFGEDTPEPGPANAAGGRPANLGGTSVPSVRRERRRTDVRALTWAIAAGTRVGRRTRALRWSRRWARIYRFEDRGNFSHQWREFWPAEAPRPHTLVCN